MSYFCDLLCEGVVCGLIKVAVGSPPGVAALAPPVVAPPAGADAAAAELSDNESLIGGYFLLLTVLVSN